MTALEFDLTPIVDQLVERIVDEVTDRLAARLFGPTPEPAAPEPEQEPQPVKPPAPEQSEPASHDSEKRVCEICGRVGTRRYVPVGDGRWKCSPTATACAPRFRPPGAYVGPPRAATVEPPAPAPAPPSDNPPNKFPRNVTPGVTARCQDCTRTWTLTGRTLRSAIDMHEMKQAHIVTVFEESA